MARPPRLFAPGFPSHVRLRGNDGQAIFRDDSDRLHFLHCLAEAARRREMKVHAYVLMTNHVHLLVTGARVTSIAKSIQSIGTRFVRFFNNRHSRTGTLWEGRYRSDLVDSDAYFLACLRYVEMNSVRAGLSPAPDKYPWSSCRFHAWGIKDDLVTPHEVYLGLGTDASSRQDAYRKLFDDPIPAVMVERIRNIGDSQIKRGQSRRQDRSDSDPSPSSPSRHRL